MLAIVVALMLAVVFALLRAFGVTGPLVGKSRLDFGWLALACLFAGVWAIPALLALP